jgi:GNAT superfamily N-acetyltransferase
VSLTVHPLTGAELDATNQVIKAAYNNPYGREETLRCYLALQPDGTCIVKEHGRVVGFGGAIDYGPFAYIGLMSVHPAMQRHGIGQLIMDSLLNWLAARGCPTALLDATPAGKPLYERSGFVEEDTTVVMRRPMQSGSLPQKPLERVSILDEHDLPALVAFDTPYFGAERTALLTAYRLDNPRRVLVTHDDHGQITAYLIAQPFILGPWVSRTPEEAERLLASALALPFERDLNVFVSAQNADALDLLERHGFNRHRTLSHMRKGKPIQRSRATALYGQTSLGFG